MTKKTGEKIRYKCQYKVYENGTVSTFQYNLTDAFDTTPAITVEELQLMTTEDIEARASAMINWLSGECTNVKLINNVIYTSNDCSGNSGIYTSNDCSGNSGIKAFLRAMTIPVEELYYHFMTNRDSNLYRLKMNGQVCNLRRVLNEAFPEALGLISIEDDETKGGEWLFLWDEDYDAYLYYSELTDEGTMVWDESAILEGVSSFIVCVPATIKNVNNDAKIRALLNEYKLLSKSYTIIYE